MRVIFPMTYKPNTRLIEYPDATELFEDIKVVDADIVAKYKGSLPLPPFTGDLPEDTTAKDEAKAEADEAATERQQSLVAEGLYLLLKSDNSTAAKAWKSHFEAISTAVSAAHSDIDSAEDEHDVEHRKDKAIKDIKKA